MAGDPYRVFAEASEHLREAVKVMWPDLYEALARLDEPRRAWGCALAVHYDQISGRTAEYAPVTGRLWLNGPPACADCLARTSDRPGGYPLDRIDPRDWK